MSNARLVIETNKSQKEALVLELERRGLSLTSWFNDKIEEFAPSNETWNFSSQADLEELNDSATIFEKLNEKDWSFHKEHTTYLTHNLHPYPAKFIPQIPNLLIRHLSLRGELIWDPFGGSGTTALEALLLGRQAVSNDIHPIATLIGRVKTTSISNNDETALRAILNDIELVSSSQKTVEDTLHRHSHLLEQYVPNIPNVEKWFHKNVIQELAYLKHIIEQQTDPIIILVLKSVLSKIILRVSFQDGETRYVSKPRDVQKGTVLSMYSTQLDKALIRLRNVSEALSYKDAVFKTADLRFDPIVTPNSVDAIITSPPYPNATDYHLYHRFRLFWLGHDPRKLSKKEIGSHLRHQKEKTGIENYLSEMRLCLNHMYLGLRPRRYAVLVLGDARFKGKDYLTAQLVAEEAKAVGFSIVGIIDRPLPDNRRSFVSPARRLRRENLLVLQKEAGNSTFFLSPPPYKLRSYEEILRKREIETLLDTSTIQIKNDSLSAKISPLFTDRLNRLTFTHHIEASNYAKSPTWQAILENGDVLDSRSRRKDSKYVTHGLHNYKGKFYPQLAKSMFNLANLKPSDSVLDPFSGSGTVALEGFLNGLKTTGFDLNPLAVKIAKAKTVILTIDPRLTESLLERFLSKINSADRSVTYQDVFSDLIHQELESWFSEKILNKLAQILISIEQIIEPTVREFVEICLSSIIRDISQQDPKDLRIRRRKIPLEDAPVDELLAQKIQKQAVRLKNFARIANKSPHPYGTAKILLTDCREASSYSLSGIKNHSINAVVTSPPYATALPYIDTDRLSILVLFGKKSTERHSIESSLIGAREIRKTERDFIDELIEGDEWGNVIHSETAVKTIKQIYDLNKKADVGFRRKNKAALLFKYYRDMTTVFTNLETVVAPKGNLFFVIGDNQTTAGGVPITISSNLALQEIGQSVGWTLNEVIPITVTQENRHHNKNGITTNHIIWFKV